MPEPGVYIWIRATLDWGDEAAVWAQLPERLKPKIELWNDIFTIPYHLFRRRVREIAAANHGLVEGLTVAAWDEIPPGSVVMPVDDDDWFAPDAAHALAAAQRPDALAYVWNRNFLEIPYTWRHAAHLVAHHTVGKRMPFTCTTNNYAFVKADEYRPLLEHHIQASRWVDSAAPGLVARVDADLSLMNRNLASQTQFPRRVTTRRELLIKLRAYRLLYRRKPRRALAWSAPYRADMLELVRELEVRPRG